MRVRVKDPRLTPLFVALLLAYPAMQPQRAQAEGGSANTQETLPDLGRPSEKTANFNVTPSGATLSNTFDGKRLVVSPEYSQQTGLSLGGAFALPLGENAAGGLVATVGDRKNEVLLNAGLQLNPTQRLIATLGQLRQKLDFNFISGTEKAEVVQTSGALSYQHYLGEGWLNGIEVNGYLADTPSRDLTDKTYAIDTAALYELWNDPRRIAGGRITGLQGKLALTPLTGSSLKLGAGGERLEYDYLTGKQSTTRATASAEWSQQLSANLNLKAGADTAAAQNRFTLGLEQTHSDGWKLGANLTGIHGRDGAPDDNQLNLTLSYTFGAKGTKPATGLDGNGPAITGNRAHTGRPAQAWGNLLDQVAKRPTFLPSQVVAKLDTTATPTRLIAVNKAALPAGSGIDTATGIITVPLGVAVTTIAGVTLNGPAFANSGQFALSGNSLVIDPSKITQPAVGVTDTYVVTVNNLGGGTTLVTVLVSHGSVKIDSIVINSNTAPTASALSITGTVQAGQQLTGHYTYADVNGDAQGVSTFRWLRNGVAIAGATAATYTLVVADVGNAIAFEVTPVSTVAPTTGTPVVSSATAAVSAAPLPAGFVSQGGLTWMPNNIGPWSGGYTDWNTANTYCTTATILGQTGWRLPTAAELSALYASGAINGQGWTLGGAWSSTPHGAGILEAVDLSYGSVYWDFDANYNYVSCVR